MVTILIPTRYDSRYIIELCISSVRKYTNIPYRIIIGNAGVNDETLNFLSKQSDIIVANCPDPLRPKDFLVTQVDTEFFMFLHDDAQILNYGWLEKRLSKINEKPNNGILGVVASNYMYGISQYFTLSCINKRFFPFGLLVRKEVQDELMLCWGKINGFDTGALAYLQFLRQKKWKFTRYKFDNDIRHWGGMTWIVRKKTNIEKKIENSSLDIDGLMSERASKIHMIKDILSKKQY